MAETKEKVKKTPVRKKAARPSAKRTAPAKKTSGDTAFAVIETGGKQYRVAAGDTLKIEKLADAEIGKKVVFEKVLLIDNGKDTLIGEPYVDGAKVEGEIADIGKNKKISIVRFKSKSRYHKKTGHRQPFVKVNIVKLPSV